MHLQSKTQGKTNENYEKKIMRNMSSEVRNYLASVNIQTAAVTVAKLATISLNLPTKSDL